MDGSVINFISESKKKQKTKESMNKALRAILLAIPSKVDSTENHTQSGA